MLTTFDGGEYVYRALRAGVSGYLLKDAPPERLVEAVRTAAAGDALIAPEITRRIIAEFAHTTAPTQRSAATTLMVLSEAELETLRLVGRGRSNAEIATSLGLTEDAVRDHIASLSEKLELRDRAQAVVIAYECGLVEPERR
jgi:DNA-binding NarL/FixJ family response regulator